MLRAAKDRLKAKQSGMEDTMGVLIQDTSALTHSEGTGSRASLSKMSFGVLVQTKGFALVL